MVIGCFISLSSTVESGGTEKRAVDKLRLTLYANKRIL
jgi:hypothetical protein